MVVGDRNGYSPSHQEDQQRSREYSEYRCVWVGGGGGGGGGGSWILNVYLYFGDNIIMYSTVYEHTKLCM